MHFKNEKPVEKVTQLYCLGHVWIKYFGVWGSIKVCLKCGRHKEAD